ncbi:MAG: hypothetical protein WBC26_11340 [Alphaproteobacteria bacterium]|nr:hypothetical protein [Alphaproteobacteria bacterium]MBP6104706.1 hypothetical protein [Gammaproteobacteria bacterium]
MIVDIKDYTRLSEKNTFDSKLDGLSEVKKPAECIENITIFTKRHKSEVVEKAIQRAKNRSW